MQVVVAKGDGSFYWEELADNANRTLDVAGDALTVTCHMGGDTDVLAAGDAAPTAATPAPAGPAAEQPTASADPPSVIDMSVDMDAAQELNPAFCVQVLILLLAICPDICPLASADTSSPGLSLGLRHVECLILKLGCTCALMTE